MRRALVRAPALDLDRLIGVLAVALAAVPVVVYLWIAGHRIGYPYELDWLEGGTVELVGRVVHGQGLYSPPSLGYVGFTYTPLYSLVAAAVAEITGLGFLPLRIVSLASSLVIVGGLGLYVRAVTGDWVAGCVAGGLFCATYGLTGWFFDVGRLDSMFLALAVLTLWLGRSSSSVRAGIGVGVLAFLAFFTKQVGLIAVGPALVASVLWRPRAGIAALLTLVVLAGASTLVLDAATDNWYRYYIVGELAGQPSLPQAYADFWRLDLYAHFHVLTLLAVLGLLAALPWGRSIQRRMPSRAAVAPVLYDVCAALGLLLAAWVSRVHSGGYQNVLMPAYAACAGIGGCAFGLLRRRGAAVALVATALLALQLHSLFGHPGRALPLAKERPAGQELISTLRALPGPILVLRHPWYGTLAGQGVFAQSDGITEVLRSKGARGAVYLRHALIGALNRYRIQTVVLDVPPPSWLAPQLRADFELVPGDITQIPLQPPADITTAPTYLYVRR